jgi:hypothetical protein
MSVRVGGLPPAGFQPLGRPPRHQPAHGGEVAIDRVPVAALFGQEENRGAPEILDLTP